MVLATPADLALVGPSGRPVTPAAMDSTHSLSIAKHPPKAIKKITCLGSGFVGGPSSAVIAFKSSVEVTVVDINVHKIAAWQSNALPIYEPGLYEIVRAVRDDHPADHHRKDHDSSKHANTHHPTRPRLFFSTNIDQAIRDADLVFVCVNTPTKAHGIGKGSAADLDFVEAATRTIARVATQDTIVVEKSTVPCNTAQSIREIVSSLQSTGRSWSSGVTDFSAS